MTHLRLARSPSLALALVLALAPALALIPLAACRETTVVTCDPGYTVADPPVTDGGTPLCSICRTGYEREELPDGGFVCTLPDGGMDAGDADAAPDADADVDAGSDTGVDAGPCGIECTGDEPYCDATTGLCAACLVDAHCTEAGAAKCGTGGVCVACDDSTQCDAITGTEVCATAGQNAGHCVQCAPGEVDACGGNPCNPASNACSAYGEAVVGTCEACDSDANCSEALNFCVPMEFEGVARTAGYCLKATPGCSRPFGVVISGRASLSGVGGQAYCGVNEGLTTCEAVNALLLDATCPGGVDSECPEGGICETLDPGAAAFVNRCTYPCTAALQCPTTPIAGSTCGDGTGGDDYCGG